MSVLFRRGDMDDHGPFDPDELVQWATNYGHPEGWAKRAQQLHAENEHLRAVVLAVRTEAVVAAGGWMLSNATFEKVRFGIEGSEDLA